MRRKRQSTAEEYDLDKGTVETRQNQKRNRESTVDRVLRECKRETYDLKRAADAIYQVYESRATDLEPRISSLERVDGGTGADIPARLQAAYTQGYKPWREYVPGYMVIINGVIFDMTLTELNIKYFHPSRSKYAKDTLLTGLKFYSDISQWGLARAKEQMGNTG